MAVRAFKDFILKLVEEDFLFTAFAHPNSDRIEFQIQLSPEILSEAPSDSDNGFLLAPFDYKNSRSVWIAADYSGNDLSQLPIFPKRPQYNSTFQATRKIELQREDYLQKLRQLKQIMNEKEVSKVVYSRQTSFELNTNSTELFFSLAQTNKDAFVYLVNLPGKLQHVGASPEVLLEFKDGKAHTMALAGTRKYIDQNTGIDWNLKEQMEQEIVQNDIDEKLTSFGLEFSKSKTHTKYLNSKLAHLCTEYNISTTSSFNWFDLINALHPTPAVCGTPKKAALELIEAFELHERNLYTGYLGPIYNDQPSKLFVNLRCAEVFSNEGIVFVGGGITSDSDPEQEWEETELKSRTILQDVNSGSNL